MRTEKILSIMEREERKAKRRRKFWRKIGKGLKAIQRISGKGLKMIQLVGGKVLKAIPWIGCKVLKYLLYAVVGFVLSCVVVLVSEELMSSPDSRMVIQFFLCWLLFCIFIDYMERKFFCRKRK